VFTAAKATMATNLQDGKRCFIVTQTMQNTHYPTISKDQTFFYGN